MAATALLVGVMPVLWDGGGMSGAPHRIEAWVPLALASVVGGRLGRLWRARRARRRTASS
jgi:hypothetical protein